MQRAGAERPTVATRRRSSLQTGNSNDNNNNNSSSKNKSGNDTTTMEEARPTRRRLPTRGLPMTAAGSKSNNNKTTSSTSSPKPPPSKKTTRGSATSAPRLPSTKTPPQKEKKNNALLAVDERDGTLWTLSVLVEGSKFHVESGPSGAAGTASSIPPRKTRSASLSNENDAIVAVNDMPAATTTTTSTLPIADDGNFYYCGVCKGPGDVVCCDGCPQVFHQDCVPEGASRTALLSNVEPWYCPECIETKPSATTIKRVVSKRKRSVDEIDDDDDDSHSKTAESHDDDVVDDVEDDDDDDDNSDNRDNLSTTGSVNETPSPKPPKKKKKKAAPADSSTPKKTSSKSTSTPSSSAKKKDKKDKKKKKKKKKRDRSGSVASLTVAAAAASPSASSITAMDIGTSTSIAGDHHIGNDHEQDDDDDDPFQGLFSSVTTGVVQATPAFYFFLAEMRPKIEKSLIRKHRTFNRLPKGMERNELIAKEGAHWWIKLPPQEVDRFIHASMKDFEQRVIEWKEEKNIRNMTANDNDPDNDDSHAEKDDETLIYETHHRLYLKTAVGSKPFQPDPSESNNKILLELLQDVRFHPLPMIQANRPPKEYGEMVDVDKVSIPHFDVHGPVSTSMGDECLGCTRGFCHWCNVLKRNVPAVLNRARLQPPLSSWLATRVGLGLQAVSSSPDQEEEQTSSEKDVQVFSVRDAPAMTAAKALPNIPFEPMTSPSERGDGKLTR
jgi:PHD-finger